MKHSGKIFSVKYPVFTSAGYLVSLTLLIVNDLYLKRHFPNLLTGKLSDFAGIFAFSLFWLAMFPRAKTILLLSIGMLFAVWKSPYSQGAIDHWNALHIFPMSRAVDYTDIFALTMLPLAFVYFDYLRRVEYHRIITYGIILISLFAFTGTSFPPKEIRQRYQEMYTIYAFGTPRPTYYFDISVEEVLQKFSKEDFVIEKNRYIFSKHRWDINASPGCRKTVIWEGITDNSRLDTVFDGAIVELRSYGSGSYMQLIELNLCNVPKKRTQREAIDFFTGHVLNRSTLDIRKIDIR